MPRETQKCDECQSLYFVGTSQMAALCPKCAHYLCGYPNCAHDMQRGRCTKCFWNGSTSPFIRTLKQAE